MFPDIRMGLPRPEKLDDQLREAADINAMRQAIERGRRDSNIIHSCFMNAEFNGLSGEDKYVMLAYHALVALEQSYQMGLKLTGLLPAPSLVAASQPTGDT